MSSTAVAVGEHAHKGPALSLRDLIDAHRIARHAVLTNPAAYADDLAAVDADPHAVAVYRLAANLRARAEAVADHPVFGPADDPFVCAHCQYRRCRVTHVVFCECEEDGNVVYVGRRCAKSAERFMESTAIRRVSKVRVDRLDAGDFEWLLEAAA